MKLLLPISLVIVIALIWSCEKQNDDHYLVNTSDSSQTNQQYLKSQVNLADMPYYYKDSLREASLIRAKNVLSKYEGYELIETRVEEVKNPSDLHKKGTVIERIRNKKDTLCIRVYWKTNQISKMIFGIEYKEADKLNLLCKTFDEHSSETPIYYEIKYLIKKRKWSRLNFEFEGQNIQVLSHQE